MPQTFNNRINSYRHIIAGTTGGDRVVVTTMPTLIHSVQAFNVSSAAIYYVHIFDSTAIVSTAGGNADKTIVVPFGAVAETSSRFPSGAGAIYQPSQPFLLDNGFTFAVGGNINSTTAYTTVAANIGVINFDWETYRDS